MKYAIFSDIHSNLQAYETVIEDFKKEKVDKCYCIGDIVGYGANPKECIQITQHLNCPVVCGNHDYAVAGRISTESFNQNASIAISWSQQHLEVPCKDYLEQLPFIHKDNNLALVHGSLNLPNQFNYILSIEDAENSMRFQKTKLCFVGHSHRAVVFYKTHKGNMEQFIETSINIGNDESYLINVGSVGQPRDGDWRACYCIYDDEKNVLWFKRLEYDIKTASEAIISKGLPERLAQRLKKGR